MSPPGKDDLNYLEGVEPIKMSLNHYFPSFILCCVFSELLEWAGSIDERIGSIEERLNALSIATPPQPSTNNQQTQ